MSDSPASKGATSASTANSRTPGASGAAGAPASSGGGHELKRVMGPGLLLLFIVGDILGTGVYALTGNIAVRSAAPRGHPFSSRSWWPRSPRSPTWNS